MNLRIHSQTVCFGQNTGSRISRTGKREYILPTYPHLSIRVAFLARFQGLTHRLEAGSHFLPGEPLVKLCKGKGVLGDCVPHFHAVHVHKLAAAANRLGLEKVPAQRTGCGAYWGWQGVGRGRRVSMFPLEPCCALALASRWAGQAHASGFWHPVGQAGHTHLWMKAASRFFSRRDHRRPGGRICLTATPLRLIQLSTFMQASSGEGEPPK